MLKDLEINGTYLFYIGVSYKKANVALREKFSIDDQTKRVIFSKARQAGMDTLLIISTCNRTEILGFAKSAEQLINLLCEHTQGSYKEFEKVGYVHKNRSAIQHIFKVGTGLDSQILGDFEIISQVKNSAIFSKKHQMLNPFMERLVNTVIRASKRVKNETDISTGATSVSFASVQYILKEVPQVSEKNILLFGTGKIGRNTCENLIKHTKNRHITLVNRTKCKADEVAGKFNLLVKEYADIQAEIAKTDVLIVATGAQNPTISKHLVHTTKPLLILDLSMPRNVSKDVLELPNVTLLHLDELSQITDTTLVKRELQIPLADQIITDVISEFEAWFDTRKFAPTIKALKTKLVKLRDSEIHDHKKKDADFNEDKVNQISDKIINKITAQVASHLRENNDSKASIELIQKVFQLQNI